MKHSILKLRIAAALLCCLFLLSGCGANDSAHGTAAASAPESVNAAEEPVRSVPETTAAPETDAPETTEAPETDVPETTEPPETAEPPEDTKPPFFLYLVSNVTVERGSSFDPHHYLSYIDDLDAEVELTVEGSVDTEAPGTTQLKLILTDDAGNSAHAYMTVNVVESAPESTYTPLPSKSFADFAATYQTNGAMVGIDVSKWQSYIDFQQVAAAGCEFVIIRMGGYYAGELFEDPYFASNIRNAKAAGLKVGVYWYSEENSAELVRENADYLYSLLDGEALDFPIFFDWEDYVHFEDYRMSMRELNEMFLAFRQEAEARGYRAALYNSKNFLELLWSEEVLDGGVWLAHYTDQTNYKGTYFLWQQGLARIAGISGDVDVDVCYPDRLS